VDFELKSNQADRTSYSGRERLGAFSFLFSTNLIHIEGVSDLETFMDYFALPRRSCEIFVSRPIKTEKPM
jgi:hypothetical protein